MPATLRADPRLDAAADVTQLIGRWRAGDAQARERIAVLVYPVLRAMARKALAREARLPLDATELAHEAYLRLLQQHGGWHDRSHLLAVVAQVLRRVVMDLIRRQAAQRRDAGREVRIDGFAELPAADGDRPGYWLALDEALDALARLDPTAARIVEWRYFGGMDNNEIAEALGVGTATVGRHWRFARAWLRSRL